MTISLTQEKANKLNSAVTRLILSCERLTTLEVAQVFGLIISSFPVVMYVPLHSRVTEHENSEALKQDAGNFYFITSLTPLARSLSGGLTILTLLSTKYIDLTLKL